MRKETDAAGSWFAQLILSRIEGLTMTTQMM